MKTSLIFITCIAFFLSPFYSYAQREKKRNYKIWIESNVKDIKYKGRLIKLKDSSIVISFLEDKILEIPVKEIDKLKFRRKGAIGKGAGIGAATGVIVGIISGLADGDDPPPEFFFEFSYTAEEKAGGAAVSLGILGAATGSVIGSLKKKFKINGLQENYNRLRPELIKYQSD
jgi:hypothetical protein